MKKWILIGFIGSLLLGCEDFNNQNPVPHVPVNYTLNITSEYPHFTTPLKFITITQKRYVYESIGYSGLLIWIGMDEKYYAADLCCPNCVNKTKPVEVDGLYAVCPTCGEEFDLSYGYAFPTKGITKYPLRKYQAILHDMYSIRTLQIRN